MTDLNRSLEINHTCTACGACLSTCHKKALVKAPVKPFILTDLCDLCYACIEICPRDAIFEVEA